MDIAALSVVSSSTALQNAAGILVMKKSMETAQQSSQSMINLIQQTAVPQVSLPHLGQNIDIAI